MDCCLRRFGEGLVSIPTVVESIFGQKLIIEGRTRTGRKALGLVLALAVEQGVDKWKTKIVGMGQSQGSISAKKFHSITITADSTLCRVGLSGGHISGTGKALYVSRTVPGP